MPTLKNPYGTYKAIVTFLRYPLLLGLGIGAVIALWFAPNVSDALNHDLNTSLAAAIDWMVWLIFWVGAVVTVLFTLWAIFGDSDITLGGMAAMPTGFAAVAWLALSLQIFSIPESIPIPSDKAVIMVDGTFRYPGQAYTPGFWAPTVRDRVPMRGNFSVSTELRERTDRTGTDLIRHTPINLTVVYRPGAAFEQKARAAADAARDNRFAPSVDSVLAEAGEAELEPLFQRASEAEPNRFVPGQVIRAPTPLVARVRVDTIGQSAYGLAGDPEEEEDDVVLDPPK